MKRLKYASSLFCVFFILSCSNDYTNSSLLNVSLECSIQGIDIPVNKSTTKSQNESTAVPVFISGVRLEVENLEYEVANVFSDFYFKEPELVDLSGKETFDVVLENVTVGRNRITARGICKNKALNSIYSNIEKCDAISLDDRAAQYGDNLKDLHHIYADYFNKEDVVKEITTNNIQVSIPMVTDSHRLGVVVENTIDSEYLLKVSIQDEEGKLLLSSQDFMNIGTQDAFVINNNDAKGDKTYKVSVRYFTKGSKIEMQDKTIIRTINIGSKTNFTKLYVFSRDELLESSSSMSLSWKYIEDVNSGELLGD